MSDKKASRRATLRDPGAPKRFGLRLSQLMRRSRVSQAELGEMLGGYRQDTISRVCRGVATSLALDLAEALTCWCVSEGYSPTWLYTGRGSEMVAPRDRAAYDATWLVSAPREELAGELAALAIQEAEIKAQIQAIGDPAQRRAIAGLDA